MRQSTCKPPLNPRLEIKTHAFPQIPRPLGPRRDVFRDRRCSSRRLRGHGRLARRVGVRVLEEERAERRHLPRDPAWHAGIRSARASGRAVPEDALREHQDHGVGLPLPRHVGLRRRLLGDHGRRRPRRFDHQRVQRQLMKARGLSPWSKRCLHRYAMPPQVRHRILEAVARGDRPRWPSVISKVLDGMRLRWAPIGMGFATGALVGAIALGASNDFAAGEPMAHEVISSHVRSLLADHLSDVASADGETVRTWFNGRLDYAPRVSDLSWQAYWLVGGRLDYEGGP